VEDVLESYCIGQLHLEHSYGVKCFDPSHLELVLLGLAYDFLNMDFSLEISFYSNSIHFIVAIESTDYFKAFMLLSLDWFHINIDFF
jgi:hypothetical protein